MYPDQIVNLWNPTNWTSTAATGHC